MTDRAFRQMFVLANPFKEGDLSVGGTTSDDVRVDARRSLGAVTVGEIRRTVFVDDAITASLDRSRDRRFDAELDALTVAQLRVILLGPGAASWTRRHRDALPSEAAAAVVKIMTNDELSLVARSVFNPHEGTGVTIGAPQHLGSRIQPNSPGDNEEEILFSVLEGLSYGCGDVIIGLNPASDDVDSVARLEQLLEQVVRRLNLPTRYCVLSDIVKQRDAQRHTRVDVGFQSLAGTSRTVAGMVGLDVDDLVEIARSFDGLYFETGQGSSVTNGTAEGVDMVTLEARAYGLARHVRRRLDEGAARSRWMIVNDVAGFIGPEVFATAGQLERACLEDVVMAKLHGITMGLDVCSTFHMGIAPQDLRELTLRIARNAAPAYLMAVAGTADPMLGYLTTSMRDHALLRSYTGCRMTTAMDQRLRALGVNGADAGTHVPAVVARLYAAYMKAGGDRRTSATLEEEGARRLTSLGERGFDLGITDSAAADRRVEALYAHARAALYATIQDTVVRTATTRSVRVRTAARDRDDYLAHPPAGERLREDSARAIANLQDGRPAGVQIVVSDGLNANAINAQLRDLLPSLHRRLAAAGHHVSDTDIVVDNGRVRAGYEVGGLVGAEVVVHLIGERPGTGLDTVSAYITYGRDAHGRFRWSRALDHSSTTAICGVHPRAKPADVAVAEIEKVVTRALTERRTGVPTPAASPPRGPAAPSNQDC
jgi:ethanolamine ammonia-lyase large subunit